MNEGKLLGFKYGNPEAVGYLGWIETDLGTAFVTLDGHITKIYKTSSVDRVLRKRQKRLGDKARLGDKNA